MEGVSYNILHSSTRSSLHGRLHAKATGNDTLIHTDPEQEMNGPDSEITGAGETEI